MMNAVTFPIERMKSSCIEFLAPEIEWISEEAGEEKEGRAAAA
jgi:hypothetical protein